VYTRYLESSNTTSIKNGQLLIKPNNNPNKNKMFFLLFLAAFNFETKPV